MSVTIEVKRKTGFLVLSEPVILLDNRGLLFYDTARIAKPVKAFNLPIGKYSLIEGNVRRLDNPIPYPRLEMPVKERHRKIPDNFKIKFGNNPSKCTINWLTKTMLFDNSLKRFTTPEIYFILYHEFGHAFYKTEKYADLYAINMMLKKGYNPNQIGNAHLTALSCKQIDRKIFAISKLLNI